MNRNECYELLLSAISKKEGIAMITITSCRFRTHGESLKDHEITSSKALVWDNGQVELEVGLPEFLTPALVDDALKALQEGTSKTFVHQQEDWELEYYVEVYPPPLHLIVAGAGHVAKPVVQIAKMLGFFVTVICDRPQYANEEQFPLADEVICKEYMDYFSNPTRSAKKYILLVTRGHQFDVMILRELMSKSASYIGMIGSRRRISGVFSQLKAERPEESFDHIFAPVGLDIGAQTPEEIAVSIMAEILKVKNEKSGVSLREKVGHFIVKADE
ncbi:XdhC family protein [Ammoniphilus sp. YIM 78166]|uniref:XdhC family protein n=1 Tax=Ammoniphilus sp. YIM 78166 TaxID=1644106 RepID=UPI00106FF5D8|nr:XdhC family protein [Ammoniphilus sp. YIM 78166]